MPDFTSNQTLLPDNTIGPAISGVADNMLKMSQYIASEEEKRNAKLAELAAVSMGNIFQGDNEALQNDYTKYINTVTDSSAQYKGRLPWQEQAKLMGHKQELLTKAAASQQHRTDYQDIIKKTISDPNVDAEATTKALGDWAKIPLADRPSAYTAVIPRLDVPKYLTEHVKVNPVETEELIGNDIFKYKKFDSTPQLSALYKSDRLFANKINQEMEAAGIPKTGYAYDQAVATKYLKDTYGPMFDKDDKDRQHHWPSNTTVNVSNYTPTPAPADGSNIRQINSVWGMPKGKSGKLSYAAGEEINGKQAEITFPDGGYWDLTAYNGPQHGVLSKRVRVNSLKWLPAVKGADGYYLASEEWKAGVKDPYLLTGIEQKPFFIGQYTTKEGDQYVTREYAIPATKGNVQAYANQLPKADRAAFLKGLEGKPEFGASNPPKQQANASSSKSVSQATWDAAEAQLKAAGKTPDEIKKIKTGYTIVK